MRSNNVIVIDVDVEDLQDLIEVRANMERESFQGGTGRTQDLIVEDLQGSLSIGAMCSFQGGTATLGTCMGTCFQGGTTVETFECLVDKRHGLVWSQRRVKLQTLLNRLGMFARTEDRQDGLPEEPRTCSVIFNTLRTEDRQDGRHPMSSVRQDGRPSHGLGEATKILRIRNGGCTNDRIFRKNLYLVMEGLSSKQNEMHWEGMRGRINHG